jgi:hypothetical protein
MSMDNFKCEICGDKTLHYTSNNFPDMMNVVAGVCTVCGIGNIVLDVKDDTNFKQELHQD